MLLSREVSIPSGKVLKSLSFHRFASTDCLTPRLTGSKAMLAREHVKGRAHPFPRRQKAA